MDNEAALKIYAEEFNVSYKLSDRANPGLDVIGMKALDAMNSLKEFNPERIHRLFAKARTLSDFVTVRTLADAVPLVNGDIEHERFTRPRIEAPRMSARESQAWRTWMAAEVRRMYEQKSAGRPATYDPAPRRYNPDTGEIEMAGAVRTNYSTPEALPDYLL